MSVWDSYPANYREAEVQAICRAVHAGECVCVAGLSGAGKSNLLGFLANRVSLPAPGPRFILVDCNRMGGSQPADFYRLARLAVQQAELSTADPRPGLDEYFLLERALAQAFSGTDALCLLLDRFDSLAEQSLPLISGNLRALRDSYKYSLTFVIASRRPLIHQDELAELFFGNTLWLGSLQPEDARWSVERFARRRGLDWDQSLVDQLIWLAGGYPSLLRGACEAAASGASLELASLRQHPAIARRAAEIWADQPNALELERCGLAGHPLLGQGEGSFSTPAAMDPAQFTAKEYLLLAYFQAHAGEVCDKDNLAHAAWPEDKIYLEGIRDDSLAQLVRRLRKKIEPDPENPTHIQTVAGRGYRFIP